MGLIKELVDEIIPLPKQATYNITEDNVMEGVWSLSYTFLNLIFQVIDCLGIPYYSMMAYAGNIDNLIVRWLLLLIGVPASIFSIFQFLYYFFKPVEKYVSPIYGRLFGETAIGALVASLLKLKIKTFIK